MIPMLDSSTALLLYRALTIWHCSLPNALCARVCVCARVFVCRCGQTPVSAAEAVAVRSSGDASEQVCKWLTILDCDSDDK